MGEGTNKSKRKKGKTAESHEVLCPSYVPDNVLCVLYTLHHSSLEDKDA